MATVYIKRTESGAVALKCDNCGFIRAYPGLTEDEARAQYASDHGGCIQRDSVKPDPVH
jgi:hypothetical protein